MTAALRALLLSAEERRSVGTGQPGSEAAVAVPSTPMLRTVDTIWRWAQAHPRLVDTGLAIALFVFALPGQPHGDGPANAPGGATVPLLAVAAAALILRRSHPLLVWAIAALAGVLAVLATGQGPILALPTFLALYTVGRHLRMRTTVLTTIVTGAAYTVAMAVVQGAWLDDHGDSPALSILALSGAAAAVGVAVRSQRAALRAAVARAQQAELTREEEAERRVTDERLRIARELHDIVAHHISVINVQAGVARHLLETSPKQARVALGLVRDASKTVLTEMSAVVGLLRTQDEGVPTEPAPGLAGIGSLLDSARRAGLDVTSTLTGEPYELPPISDLTAYRVVQESVTNAIKYGTGTADLGIDYAPERIRIQVRNPIAMTTATPPPGHGLIGMRERVEAAHGRLAVGPEPDGTFGVRAEIPRNPG